MCSEKAFWVHVDEERLANQNLIEDLQTRFCSKPSAKLSEASSNPNSGKKSKELKVLDAKSAQNLSVVLGRQIRYWIIILLYLYFAGGALKYISYSDLRKCILMCDTSVLTENLLQSLIQVTQDDLFCIMIDWTPYFYCFSTSLHQSSWPS